MTTPIPVTTLSNLRDNFVPPSLLDLLYMQQGSEHDRDSGVTLGELLESQVIQSFLNDRQQWKTFFTEYDEENDVCRTSWVGWEKNVILRSPYTKNIRWDATISRNAIVVVIPDFPENSDYIVISKSPGWSIQIPKGNIGVLFFNESGILDKFFPLPCSSSFTNAQFNALTVLSSITLPALSILSEYIATSAVTSNKIGPGAVINSKIAIGAVHEENIDTAAVTAGKIANGAVINSKIAIGAVHEENIDTAAITTGKLANYAVETSKIKNKAVTSEKLADQLTFVNRPLLPPNILYSFEVTSAGYHEILPNYNGVPQNGIIFHADDPIPGWGIKLHILDADPYASNGRIYRIYNNTPNDANVNDYTTDTFYTRILAWSFKDFYYLNGWRMD